MRTFCPARMPPRRRKYNEHPAPHGMAAASSKVALAGLRARGPFSVRQVYSAYVLAPSPKTWSPGLNRRTSFPTASTSPAKSDPRMGFLGFKRPKKSRMRNGSAFRRRTSPEVTVVARTRIRT